MKELVLNKKYLIIATVILSLITAIICGIGFNSFWALFVIMPISLGADVCYFTLPLTVIGMIFLSVYSHVVKDFQKFSKIYEILAFMIVCGILNIVFENTISSPDGIIISKIFLSLILLITLLLNITFFERKQDTRLYIYVFLPYIILLIAYGFVNTIG